MSGGSSPPRGGAVTRDPALGTLGLLKEQGWA